MSLVDFSTAFRARLQNKTARAIVQYFGGAYVHSCQELNMNTFAKCANNYEEFRSKGIGNNTVLCY